MSPNGETRPVTAFLCVSYGAASEETPDREMLQSAVADHGGRLTRAGSAATLATFESVNTALDGARTIVKKFVRPDTVSLRFGLHAEIQGANSESFATRARQIATSLAQQAAPNELRMSATASELLGDGTAQGDLVGEARIPDITTPIRVYRVLLQESVTRSASRSFSFEWSQVVTVLILGFLAGGVIFLSTKVQERQQPTAPAKEVAKPIPAEPPAPVHIPEGERPIAILPFATPQGDEAIEDYLRTGLAEDLALNLAGTPGASVLPPDVIFTLPLDDMDPGEAASVLGARFVISGTAVRSTDGFVIDATVFDATANEIIGSERITRPAQDLPRLGALLARKIASILDIPPIAAGVMIYDNDHAAAYDLALRGRHAAREKTRDSYVEARAALLAALTRGERLAPVHAHLALLELTAAHYGWAGNRRRALDRAVDHAQRAAALDDAVPFAQRALGHAQLWNRGRLGEATAAFERALEINPSDTAARAGLGFALTWSGDPATAVTHLRAAIGQSPHHPLDYLWYLGHAYFVMERFEDAAATLSPLMKQSPRHIPATILFVAALGLSDRVEEGETVLRELIRTHGDAVESAFTNVRDAPYKDPADMERFFEGLKRVGWSR